MDADNAVPEAFLYVNCKGDRKRGRREEKHKIVSREEDKVRRTYM